MYHSKLLNNKFIVLSVFILSMLYILLCLTPSVIDFDESYTMTLIKGSWSKLIYLDSIDVHPPLYYLLLKGFVGVTTFWTRNIVIKVIFARLFTLITSIISFAFMYKIALILHIRNNILVQWVILLLLPNVIGFKFAPQQLVNIRMYSLASMFVLMTFYYLIRFYTNFCNRNLIIISLSSICAAYTHYYAAIFSGLFILFYFLNFLKHKRYKRAIQVFIPFCLMCLSFIFWLPIFFKQLISSNTYWMNNKFELKELIGFIILILLFICPIYVYYRKANNHVRLHLQALIFVISITFIFALVYSVLRKPMFQYRYMLPVLLLYIYLSANLIIKNFIHVHYFKWYDFIIITAIVFNFVFMVIDQGFFHYPKSIKNIETYNYLRKSPKHNIYLKNTNSSFNDSNYIIYIPSLHKDFVTNKSFMTNSSIYANKEYKITFKSVINEMKYR